MNSSLVRHALLVLASVVLVPSMAHARPHVDKGGFVIDVPAGFKLTTHSTGPVRGVRLENAGQAAASVSFAETPTDKGPAEVAEDMFAGCVAGAQDVQLVAPPRVSTAGAYCELRQLTLTRKGVRRRAVVLVYIAGPGSTMYLMSAPDASFARVRPTLAGILRSFHFGTAVAQTQASSGKKARDRAGASSRAQREAAAADSKPAVRWVDPKEQAFSVSLPRGWKVSAGETTRSGPWLLSHWFQAASADGGARVVAYAPHLLTCVVPCQSLAMAGLGEGAWYEPGYGVHQLVMRPLPPAEYLQLLARNDTTFAGLETGASTPEPGLSGQELVGRTPVMQQAAWVEVRDRASGLSGRALVQVTMVSATPPTVWYGSVLGYVARSGHEASAQAALGVVARTFQVDERWARQQAELASRASGIATQASEYCHNLIMSASAQRDLVNQRVSRWRHEATMGVVTVQDADGQQREASNRYNYYWGGSTGVGGGVQGTNDEHPPGPDLTQLLERLR